MIKNIIYVEDGSVDVDELQECLGEETKIIVYRQGATKPEILQLAEPMTTVFDDSFNKFIDKLSKIRQLLIETYGMKQTKKLQHKIKEVYNTIFGDEDNEKGDN